MSQITTHVLDTSTGKPAEGVLVSLQHTTGTDQWESISSGSTNIDGRMASLLPSGKVLPPGTYRLLFETKAYFDRQKIKSFYPFVPVVFEVADARHYHVPLLLNPFGYSTYRGS